MNKEISLDVRVRWILFMVGTIIVPIRVNAMNVAGPIIANNVIESGSITFSSVTMNQMIVSTNLNVTGTIVGLAPQFIQMKFSSTTVTTTVSTSAWTSVTGLKVTAALSNSNNYFHISLTGVLSNTNIPQTSNFDGAITVFRDSVDLANGNPDHTGLVNVRSVKRGENWRPVGIVVTDSPGDTNSHDYEVFINTSNAGNVAGFPHSAGYLIVEEISR